MIEASVIVPARNAEATLPRTLACLVSQETDLEYEVIVVDDGSEDGTAAIAEEGGDRVGVVRQPAGGPAAARNRGVAEARGQTLAFCDADCFPEPGWLAAGVQALESADLVQGRVLPDPEASMAPFDRSLWITRVAGLWETANLFSTRELFEHLGGFEDWLEPVAGKAMAEDLWFGWRAVRYGARTAFCPEALAYHAVFQQRAVDWIEERRRQQHFPEIVAKVPELRDSLLYARVFLNRRTAAFDLALAGLAAALTLRRPLPLLAAAPYANLVYRRATKYRRLDWKIAVVDIAADIVSCAALVRGSLRARTPVL